AASPDIRQPLQRLLDRRMQSVSTFVSSAASLDMPGMPQTARETRSWAQTMPEAILFPANKPTSRADAEVLHRWVTSSFQSYARRHADSKENIEEDLTKTVQELVPVLSIGLNEVVRQVSQHCLERGVVLEKIWRTYVELFEDALAEAREALRRQKEKTSKCEEELQRVRDEAAELKAKHPTQLDKLRQTLTTKFDQRQNELVQQLTNTRSTGSWIHFNWQGLGTRSKEYRMGRGSTSLHGRSAGIECVAGKCECVAGNCVPAYWREDTGGATGHWRRHAPGRKASSWRPACMAWSEAAAPAEADQAVKRMKGNPGLHKPFPCPPAARLRNFKSDLSRPPSLIMVGASASGKSEYAKSQEPHWSGTRAR
ncbi:unnamed protein product, partial [Effrenium voratum]